MGTLYAESGHIYTSECLEIYVPTKYFADNVAVNEGGNITTLGILYCAVVKNGTPGTIKLFNVPTTISIMNYETHNTSINVGGNVIDVLALSYLPGQIVMHQTLPKGREIANDFLDKMLAGKLPKTLNYSKIIDIWWKNLEISGISYKVPSKLFEMIIAAIYRDPNNPKRRYGQKYGMQTPPNGFDYTTDNVRNVVKNLSTFSGMVFEDMGAMISNGINNDLNGVEEPVSPLEKIIYY